MPLPVVHQSNLHRKYHWLCAQIPPGGKSCKQEHWAERAQAGSAECDEAHSEQNQIESSKFPWLYCIYTKAEFSPVYFTYQTPNQWRNSLPQSIDITSKKRGHV